MTQFLIEGNGWPAGRNTRVEVGGQLTLQLPGQLLEKKMYRGGKRIRTLLIKGIVFAKEIAFRKVNYY